MRVGRCLSCARTWIVALPCPVERDRVTSPGVNGRKSSSKEEGENTCPPRSLPWWRGKSGPGCWPNGHRALVRCGDMFLRTRPNVDLGFPRNRSEDPLRGARARSHTPIYQLFLCLLWTVLSVLREISDQCRGNKQNCIGIPRQMALSLE
jgi:hypothetical protein